MYDFVLFLTFADGDTEVSEAQSPAKENSLSTVEKEAPSEPAVETNGVKEEAAPESQPVIENE